MEVRQGDLFPDGRADLIVCNPPWIPARPISLLDHAVYDENSRMHAGDLGYRRAEASGSGSQALAGIDSQSSVASSSIASLRASSAGWARSARHIIDHG